MRLQLAPCYSECVKTINILLVIILLFVAGWYFAVYRPALEEVSQIDIQNNEDTKLISAIDPKSGISFTYPDKLQTSYVSSLEWPPKFVSSLQPFNCDIDIQTAAMSGFASRKEIFNDTDYCIWERSEGAAGSSYTDYQITYKKDKNYVTMNLTLRYVQCDNYPQEEAKICKEEQGNFSFLSLVDKIAQSVKVPTAQ